MKIWQRHHRDGIVAFVTQFSGEPYRVSTTAAEGGTPRHRDVTRITLRGAQRRADELVASYYRHRCGPGGCGSWQRIEPWMERRNRGRTTALRGPATAKNSG